VDWVDFELVPGKFLLSELTGSGNNQEERARWRDALHKSRNTSDGGSFKFLPMTNGPWNSPIPPTPEGVSKLGLASVSYSS